MIRLIFTLFFLQILFSCADNKLSDIEEKSIFFGDSTLTLGFEYYTDTTFMNEFKRGEIFEISTYSITKDTSKIMMRKNLISGCYKGACEFTRDTLVCNYWLDSINCRPELVLTTLVFKFRTFDTIKNYNLVFRPIEPPIRKHYRQ